MPLGWACLMHDRVMSLASECHCHPPMRREGTHRSVSFRASAVGAVAIGKPERHVRKASHCGTKQQSPDEITLLLLVRATYIWVLFFPHIPFAVNCTRNANGEIAIVPRCVSRSFFEGLCLDSLRSRDSDLPSTYLLKVCAV